jgi:hypothetical protein
MVQSHPMRGKYILRGRISMCFRSTLAYNARTVGFSGPPQRPRHLHCLVGKAKVPYMVMCGIYINFGASRLCACGIRAQCCCTRPLVFWRRCHNFSIARICCFAHGGLMVFVAWRGLFQSTKRMACTGGESGYPAECWSLCEWWDLFPHS